MPGFTLDTKAKAFWDGTCQYSIEGVTWTFVSFLVIAIMGMLMITLRSAYLPVEYMNDDKLNTVPTTDEEEDKHETVTEQAKTFQEQGGPDESSLNEKNQDEEAEILPAISAHSIASGSVTASQKVNLRQCSSGTEWCMNNVSTFG